MAGLLSLAKIRPVTVFTQPSRWNFSLTKWLTPFMVFSVADILLASSSAFRARLVGKSTVTSAPVTQTVAHQTVNKLEKKWLYKNAIIVSNQYPGAAK